MNPDDIENLPCDRLYKDCFVVATEGPGNFDSESKNP